MGFFSGLDTEAYDRKYTDRQLVRRMGSYLIPQRGRLVAIALSMLTISVAGTLFPILVSQGVDVLERSKRFSTAALIVVAVLVFSVLTWFANWIRRRQAGRAIGNIVMQLRSDAFKAAAEHDLSFYDRFTSGRIVSRITSDTYEFGNIVLMLTDFFSDFIIAIVLALILVLINWQLALILFAFIPVVFLTANAFRALARKVTSRGMRAMANVNQAIKETVSGIAIAKNFRQEGTIFGEFETANTSSYRVNVQRGFVLSLVFPTMNALAGITMALIIYLGGMSAAEGIVTAGSWFLFMQSLDRFLFPVQNLSAFWTQIQQGLSSAERVFALIDAEAAVYQVDNQPAPRLQGEIRFEHMCFSYNEQEKVLDDFNLHIRPGENLAIVGHTGAGKSSVAKLIARFYEYQSGSLLIDGRDIRSFDLESYRQQLGIVSQTPFLFSGTVLENICYACPGETTREEVEQLSRQIGGGDWLDSLPDGLDTQVGERGSRLSMGQRQLVSLMRVLVQKPAIFILDEATASIDPFTEWQIQQALDLVLKNSTSILIAHRLSTVKAADRIIVMKDGQIIEEGNHEELMDKGGHYGTLYDTYFRHQSLAYINTSRNLVEDEAELGTD